MFTNKEPEILMRRPDASVYLGRSDRGREIWMTGAELRRHVLVSGSTGAGKTEFLGAICASVIASGGGLVYVAGKGDVTDFARIADLAQMFGRGDDLLVLNFGGGNGGPTPPERPLYSNGLALLETGRHDEICKLLVRLMSRAGDDSPMWRARAVSLLTGALWALTWLRDHAGLQLDLETLRRHIALNAMIDLANPEKTPALPAEVRDCLQDYLLSIPGFNMDRGYEQSNTTKDQHGYLTMQISSLCGSLAGDALSPEAGAQVDFADVIANRRILVVMSPTLERAGSEPSLADTLVSHLLRASQVSRDPAPFAGRVHAPRPGDPPMLVVFDEPSAALSAELPTLAAALRFAGVAMVVATQDLDSAGPEMRGAMEGVVANTGTHVLLESARWRSNLRLVRPHRFDGGETSDARARAAATCARMCRAAVLPIAARLAERLEDPDLEASVRRGLDDALDRTLDEIGHLEIPGGRPLRTGDILILHGEDILRGVSPMRQVPRTDRRYFLRHTVHWRQNDAEVEAFHGREERSARFASELSDGDPLAGLGEEALPFGDALRADRASAKEATRLSFALIDRLSGPDGPSSRP